MDELRKKTAIKKTLLAKDCTKNYYLEPLHDYAADRAVVADRGAQG